MRLFKFVLPALILVGGLSFTSVNSFGNQTIFKATKKPCATCHTAKPPAKDGKDLNAVGKCYKEKKTLDGCAEKK